MDYTNATPEERQQYKAEVLKAVELADALDRLLSSKDFNTVFDKEKITDRILSIQKFLVHTPESREEVLKELTFYAYFDKHLDRMQELGMYARQDLEAIKEIETE